MQKHSDRLASGVVRHAISQRRGRSHRTFQGIGSSLFCDTRLALPLFAVLPKHAHEGVLHSCGVRVNGGLGIPGVYSCQLRKGNGPLRQHWVKLYKRQHGSSEGLKLRIPSQLVRQRAGADGAAQGQEEQLRRRACVMPVLNDSLFHNL